MPANRPAFKTIAPGAGQFLGLGALGELATKVGNTITRWVSPAVIVTGTISAEGATNANQRDITLTVKDRRGNAINYAAMIEVVALLNAGGTDFAATGGSTGIAVGASGKLLAIVAKKLFRGITTTAGVLQLTYVDTGTEAVYLGVRLPNGEVTVIGNLTNA